MLSEGLGKLSFWLTFVGFNVTFLVQHSLGLEGMPRRIYEYADTGNLHVLNLISTVGAFILASGVLVTVYNVLRSLRRGAVAGPDPWKANTLEWFTTSPLPNNFDVVPGALGRAHEGHPPRWPAPPARPSAPSAR
jgi:cytochrome c oxidase subunit 1